MKQAANQFNRFQAMRSWSPAFRDHVYKKHVAQMEREAWARVVELNRMMFDDPNIKGGERSGIFKRAIKRVFGA